MKKKLSIFIICTLFMLLSVPSHAFNPSDLTRMNNMEDCPKCDLSGADLVNAKKAKMNMSDANLSRANLTNATLFGVNLNNANLTGANLSKVNLRDSDLIGANLRPAPGSSMPG